MNYQALGLAVLASAIFWAVIDQIGRWRIRRSVRRFIAQFRRDVEQGTTKEQPRLYPESLSVVQLTETEVSCTHPNGTRESVAWDDLQKVEIVTTDQGPFHPDVFWVLHGSKTGCVVPQGVTGEAEFLDRMHRLPGFSNSAMIEAMTSCENRRFLCWEKAMAAERP